MAIERAATSGFQKRLRRAVDEGREGKAELIEMLSTMPVEELGRVPAHILSAVGAEGLRALAKRRLDLRPLVARPSVRRPKPSSSARTRKERSTPIRTTLLLAATFMLITHVLDVARPWRVVVGDDRSRSVDTSSWPECPRLDRHLDGCLYRTNSNRLTIRDASSYLRLDPERLAAVNMHLVPDLDRPLPRGTMLVVWRNKLSLEGRS